MIRKMLVTGASVAMAASAIAGFAAVNASGVAGAAKPAPTAGTCVISGTVTFAAPGLSSAGSVTNKTVEKSVSQITPGSAQCGSKLIKSNIPSATTECWSTLPVYSKTAPQGGVLVDGAPSACDVGGASAQGDPSINAADVKTAIKDQYSYDSNASFASSGTTAIVAALNAKPIKVVDNTNVSPLTVTSASTVAGGACGSTVGFQINGTVAFTGITHASVLVCLTTDTGPGTSGSFFADIVGGTGTIATAAVGGSSNITFSA